MGSIQSSCCVKFIAGIRRKLLGSFDFFFSRGKLASQKGRERDNKIYSHFSGELFKWDLSLYVTRVEFLLNKQNVLFWQDGEIKRKRTKYKNQQ